jgi:4-amino-4-deoxy-L-arabinose transferase-like glycosyltransferase
VTRSETRRQPGAPARLDGARALALVVAVGLAARIVHLADLSRLPLFDRPTVDAALYLDAARAWAGGAVPDVFFKPPLYPFVLSAAWRLAGDSFWALRLVSVLCGAATCGLVWWLARRWFGAGAALTAGLLYALHRGAVYFEGELVEIAVATMLQVGGLALTVRAAGGGRRAAVVAGAALGLGAVARPTSFLFAAAALAWLGRRRLAAAAAGLALAVLPVTLHNAVRGGDFVVVSSNLGLNFYLGNNPRADGRSALAPELPPNPGAAERAARSVAEGAAGGALRPSQVSAFWLRRGLAYVGDEPARVATLVVRKLFYASSAAEIGDNDDIAGLSRHLPWLGHLPVGAWILCPLGLAGLALAPRRREVNLARWYVATQIAALLPFFVVARFRLPWMPVLAVFAAWTLAEFVASWRARRRPPARLLVLTLAAGIACNVPAFGVRAPIDFDVDYKLAYAYQEQGRIDAALAAYRASLARNPRSALAANALGVLLAAAGGDLAEATRLVERALELDPARAPHYAESLAGIALQRGDAAAARAACARGLAANPDAATRRALLERRAEAERRAGDTAAEAATLREVIAAGGDDDAAARARARLRALAPAP